MNTLKTTHRPTPALLSDAWASNFGQLVHEILQEPLHQSTITPRISLIEKHNGYELKATLPGISKENINLNIEDGILTLVAHKESIPLGDSEKVLINELHPENYKRSLRLPKNADTESTDATLENGILTVILSKRKESLPKQIEVK